MKRIVGDTIAGLFLVTGIGDLVCRFAGVDVGFDARLVVWYWKLAIPSYYAWVWRDSLRWRFLLLRCNLASYRRIR